MTMMIRTDSDGIVHHVWAQRQVNSCAVASLMMADSLAKQMSLSGGEWERAKQLYANIFPINPQGSTGPMTFDPPQHGNNQNTFANMFSNFGTLDSQLQGALTRTGLKVSRRVGIGISLIASRVTDTTPVVVGIGWNTGGGHVVVATRVNSGGRIVFLDPSDGVVQEVANNGRYPGGGQLEAAWYVSR